MGSTALIYQNNKMNKNDDSDSLKCHKYHFYQNIKDINTPSYYFPDCSHSEISKFGYQDTTPTLKQIQQYLPNDRSICNLK